VQDVKDGLSHTYLLGEKYIDRDLVKNGLSWGDDAGPYVSSDRSILRWGSYPGEGGSTYYLAPRHDGRGSPTDPGDIAYGMTGLGTFNFGSAHSTGFNMALCDSSVRPINYDVSEKVHRNLCNRTDGETFEFPE
jgi:hypothetical protein